MSGRVSLLGKAMMTVEGDRQNDYGDPAANWERTAKIWSAILGVEITASQAMACMIGVKLSRLAHSPDHYDSWLDIAGYAAAWDLAKNVH